MRLAILDYGSGNLHSIAKAFARVAREGEFSVSIDLVRSAQEVRAADRLVLPGVGAFGDCLRGLERSDMMEALRERVVDAGAPFLGICVGMQLMAQRGFEKPPAQGETWRGLGWLEGDVIAIKPEKGLKIPQMGWNVLEERKSHPVFADMKMGESGLHAYFVHSYHMRTSAENILATTRYGETIAAIVGRDNYIGTQFHPEKSQRLGLALLKNFLSWNP